MICPIMNAGLTTRQDVINDDCIDYEKLFVICERCNCALWIGTYEDGMCAIVKLALKE